MHVCSLVLQLLTLTQKFKQRPVGRLLSLHPCRVSLPQPQERSSGCEGAHLSFDIDVEVSYDVVDIFQHPGHILVHVQDAMRSWQRGKVHLQPRDINHTNGWDDMGTTREYCIAMRITSIRLHHADALQPAPYS